MFVRGGFKRFQGYYWECLENFRSISGALVVVRGDLGHFGVFHRASEGQREPKRGFWRQLREFQALLFVRRGFKCVTRDVRKISRGATDGCGVSGASQGVSGAFWSIL